MASKVYFADLRADVHENLQQKLTRLMKTAGMGDIDFRDKFVAIKLHFGEPGNLAFLRPNWARTVADFVKERGGKPFLTDCNTLYVGGRKNALDHMDSAMLNGFNPMTTGCQIIIADGLKGSDEVEVPVVGGEYVKNAKIGRAVMDADVFISLTHFKGHEEAGFGGCLKISAWAAAAAPVRWNSTMPASPMWRRSTVSAAASAGRSAPTARRSSKTARPISTTTGVWAAAVVSQSVPRTRCGSTGTRAPPI